MPTRMSPRKDVNAPSRVGAQGDRHQQHSPTKTQSGIKPKVLTPRRLASYQGVLTQKSDLTKTSTEIKPKILTTKKGSSLADRRKQAVLTKTPSGIKSIPLKRSPAKKEVDEEEWEQRMETWEKKKKRLSGTEWDKSFRETARDTLKGKKPWRVPISPYKTKYHKSGCESRSPEDENNSGSSTTDLVNSEWENVHALHKNYEHSIKQQKEEDNKEEVSLELVDLKRETSKMLLDVSVLAQSEDTFQCAHSCPQRSLKVSKKNVLKENIITTDIADKTAGIPSTQTNSITLTDSNQAPPSFVKTVLSPIQSVSEYSKVCVKVQSSDGQNEIEESTGFMEKKPTGDKMLPRELVGDPNSTEKLLKSDEPNYSLKNSNTRLSRTSEQSSTRKYSDEYWIKVKSLLSDSSTMLSQTSPKSNYQTMTANETKQKHEEVSLNSQAIHSSPQNNFAQYKEHAQLSWVKQPYPDTMYREKLRARKVRDKDLEENIRRPTKDGSLGAQTEVTEAADRLNASCIDSHQYDNASEESKSNEESNRKKKHGNVSIEEMRVNVDGKAKANYIAEKAKIKNVNEKAELKNVGENAIMESADRKADINNGSSVKTIMSDIPLATHRGILAKSNPHSKNSKLEERESPTRASKALHHILTSTLKRKDDRKSKEMLRNVSYPTKERASLPAMFSCPDSEFFGRRKKPPVQPVFIRTEARQPLEKSVKLPYESVETLSSKRGMWYREFHNPEMSSDEFESDQGLVKSNCYREVIIDRSGCRTLYEGPCQVTVTQGYNDRHSGVHRGTSQSSTNNMRNRKYLVPYAEYKNIRKRPSVESLCYTD